MGSIEPTPEQLQRLMQEVDQPGPIVMINLLRYRDQAAYPAGSDATPCSGREAYQRYAAGALGLVRELGGDVVWLGAVKMPVIGPQGEAWDDALLVQYPSARTFFEMVSRADYQAVAVHRTAALADSRLLMTVQAAIPGR